MKKDKAIENAIKLRENGQVHEAIEVLINRINKFTKYIRVAKKIIYALSIIALSAILVIAVVNFKGYQNRQDAKSDKDTKIALEMFCRNNLAPHQGLRCEVWAQATTIDYHKAARYCIQEYKSSDASKVLNCLTQRKVPLP